MPDAFIPLCEALAVRRAQPVEPVRAPPSIVDRAEDDALAEIRRFRAALRDGLEVVLQRLLREIATGVVARELRLAPADIAAVVMRALESIDSPIAVRVHPEEVAALPPLDVAVIVDCRLRHGDAIVEVREGTIEATLGVRLDRVLRAETA